MGFSQAQPRSQKGDRTKRGTRGGGRCAQSQTKKDIKGNGISNLSSQDLTDAKIRVLDRGLKIAPPQKLNKFHTYMDIHRYVRKLNVQRYLVSNPIYPNRAFTTAFLHSGPASASLFNPPGTLPPVLKVFNDLTLKDLENVKIKSVRIKKDLELGMDSLCTNRNLVIHPADKGGGIVILDRKDYMQEMHRIVGDVDTYTTLPSNPNDKYKGILEKILNRGFDLNILNKKKRRCFWCLRHQGFPSYIICLRCTRV